MHEDCSFYFKWIALFVVAVSLLPAIDYYPCFPGDVAIGQWVQRVVSPDLTWAEEISHTAKFPSFASLLLLALVLSWSLAGWRGAILCLASLFGMLVFGHWIGPLITRPRPSPELVHLFRPLSGHSFPSMFALRYGSVFGFLAVLAIRTSSGPVRVAILIACALLLSVGGIARVALGAHWASDVIISYYIAILWAAWVVSLGMPDRGARETENLGRI
ncbi:MAG TPA: phosphatase PAP2 family protein [Syntrophorhabdaceae bacterium]